MSEVEEQRTGMEAEAGRAAESRLRTAILVLGMHRSGTSAAARVLSLLGAELPRTLMEPNFANPKGYWEPRPIAELHGRILSEASLAWHDVLRFPQDWYGSSREPARKAEMVELLRQEYGDSPFFVLKDPRICRLVPFWLDVLAEVEVSPSFVIVVRNPLEVAASLKERDGLSFTHGLLLWLRHTIDAERDTRGRPRAFLSYSRLLTDWEREARSVAQQLGVSWPQMNHVTRAKIEEFLSAGSRHHSATAADLAAHSATVSWVIRTYDALEQACESGEAPSSEILDDVAAQLDTADASFGPLIAELKLAAARKPPKPVERPAPSLIEPKRVTEIGDELTAQIEETERLEIELERKDVELRVAMEERDRLSIVNDELGRERDSLKAEWQSATSELAAYRADGDRLRAQVDSLDGELARLQASAKAIRNETALAYFKARRPGKVRGFGKLASWILPLPRGAGRRYLRTYLALRKTNAFDFTFYLTQYPDVAITRQNGLMHWIEHGVIEGRDPNATFSTRAYLQAHPELKTSGENPLLHYLRASS